MRAQEIVGGIGGVHAGIDEADEVAQEMIAEDHAHADGRCAAIDRAGRWPSTPTARPSVRSSTPLSVAAHRKPSIGRDVEHFVGNGSFRRPQSPTGAMPNVAVQ